MTAAATNTIRWVREYETVYILRPTTTVADADKVAERVRDVMSHLGATLTNVDTWGKRKLAYEIQKHSRGVFVYLQYVGFGDVVAELERNLRLLDEVIRFQTVMTKDAVDPASVQVNDEEVKFNHVENEDDDEDPEREAARRLGMYIESPSAPEGATEDKPKGDESSEASAKEDAAPAGEAKNSGEEATEAKAPEADALVADAPADAPADDAKESAPDAEGEDLSSEASAKGEDK